MKKDKSKKVKTKYWLINIPLLFLSVLFSSCIFNINNDYKTSETNITNSETKEEFKETTVPTSIIDSDVLILEESGMDEELAGLVLLLINDCNLGELIKSEKTDDWINGQRWRVTTNRGLFIFYTAYNEVVSIRDETLEYVYNGGEKSEIYFSYYLLEKEYIETATSWGYKFEVQNEFELITFSFPFNDTTGLVENVTLTIDNNGYLLINKTVRVEECKESTDNVLHMKDVVFEFGKGISLKKGYEVIILFDENAGAIYPKYKINGYEVVVDSE